MSDGSQRSDTAIESLAQIQDLTISLILEQSFACLTRVAGYGKKKLPDERMRAKQKELGARITEWRGNSEAMADHRKSGWR